MARLVLLTLLPLIAMAFVAASASAQNPTVQMSLSPPGDSTANGTTWSEPLTVTFSISGLACAMPVTWTLALASDATGENGTGAAATWDPAELTVTVPAGQHLADGYEEDVTSTLTVTNAGMAPALTVETVVEATAGGGNCVPPAPGDAEMTSTMTLTFGTMDATTTPELAMPSTGLVPALIAVSLAFLAIVRRR